MFLGCGLVGGRRQFKQDFVTSQRPGQKTARESPLFHVFFFNISPSCSKFRRNFYHCYLNKADFFDERSPYFAFAAPLTTSFYISRRCPGEGCYLSHLENGDEPPVTLEVHRCARRVCGDLDAGPEVPGAATSGSAKPQQHPQCTTRVPPRDAALVAPKVDRHHGPGLEPPLRRMARPGRVGRAKTASVPVAAGVIAGDGLSQREQKTRTQHPLHRVLPRGSGTEGPSGAVTFHVDAPSAADPHDSPHPSPQHHH